MPAALTASRALVSCSRENSRWKVRASCAASSISFFSSASRRSQTFLREDHDLRIVGVARQGQVLLHLVELRGVDERDRVFLPVDGLLLERGIELREGQRHGIGAERIEQIDIERRLHDPHLQARECPPASSPAGGCWSGCESRAPNSRGRHQTLGRQQIGQLACRTGRRRPHRPPCRSLNRNGRSNSAELLDLADQQPGVQDGQVDRAALQRRDGLQVAAELSGRETA